MELVRARPKLVAALAVLLLFGAGVGYGALFGSRTPEGLHVEGNRLADGGKIVRLLGVDWPRADEACVRGGSLAGGPTGASAIAALLSWHVNTVRIPLDQECWLGLGTPYRRAVEDFVARLHAAGLYVVLALGSKGDLADAAGAPQFWSEVARTFKDDRLLVFDLDDEPHGVAWFCWRDGCRHAGSRVAGMQRLVHAIRDAEAKQPIMVAGLDRGNDLSEWLAEAPSDPALRLVASFHVDDRSACATTSCWEDTVAKVARLVPVVTAAFAETDCETGFVDGFMSWADRHGISYLGRSWRAGECASASLIRRYDGTPTAYGQGLKRHLATLWGADGTFFRH